MLIDCFGGHHSLEELEFVVGFGAIIQDETKSINNYLAAMAVPNRPKKMIFLPPTRRTT